METILRKKEESEFFTNKESLSERDLKIEIMGQNVDRSYEDRSVYVNISYEKNDITTWINGEKAIELGQMLIKHGTFALEANMINHQRIHMHSTLKRFLNDKIVKFIHLKMVDETPLNYGKGFHEFSITPQFHKGKEPKYQENFSFNDIIYFSQILEDEFQKSCKSYGDIIFHNYENKFIDKVLNNKRLRENKLERICQSDQNL